VSSASSFRTDINGLRAVAVVIVVLYHLGVPGFHGGYVGVDVFFVISGYLMTQVVLGKLDKDAFSAVDFYAARARRLVPALLAVDAVLLVLGLFALLPLSLTDLCKEIVGSLTFTSNIEFWRERGYFDAPSQTKWLLHTWSLSVEWQFYLLYPLFLVVIARLRIPRAGLAILAALSLALAVVVTPHKPEAAFFLLPTRTWELVVGGLVFHWQRGGRKPLTPRPLLALVGLAFIVVATLAYDESMPYPGYRAILPVLGSMLVVAAASPTRLLANPPLQLLGDTSYSYYLWHWPFIVAARVFLADSKFSLTTMAALALSSFAVAVLSHRFIETRFRARGSSLSGPAYLARTGLALAAVAGPALVVVALAGVPARVPPLAARNEAIGAAFAWTNACKEREPCAVGPAHDKRVLFWGDSHVEQLLPAAQALVDEHKTHDEQPIFMAQSACLPVRTLSIMSSATTCPSFNDAALARAQAADIDTVVIASIWMPYFRAVLYDDATTPTVCLVDGAHACDHTVATASEALAIAQAQLTRDLGLLHAAGKRVFVVAPVPIYDRNVAQALARSSWSGGPSGLALSRAQHDALIAPFTAMLRAVAAATGAVVIDPADALCRDPSACTFAEDGASLYRDNSHLSSRGAVLVAPLLEPAFVH
jgi:peptidoglycan/LPS O-acetylase OafA/YrhL